MKIGTRLYLCRRPKNCARIFSRCRLDKIISSAAGISPDKINYRTGRYGKPELAGTLAGKISFSVSYSEELVMLAISDKNEVGADIEKIGRYKKNVAQDFFSAEELACLESKPVRFRNECFYEIWTAKEAFIKAIGRGLSYPLNDFTAVASMDRAIGIKNIPQAAGKWMCKLYDVGSSRKACLCMDGNDFPLEITSI